MMWQIKAVLSMLLFVPMFMGPKLMAKSFGVSSEVWTVFLGIGGMTGVLSFLVFQGNTASLAIGVIPALIIIAVGIIFGASANILMYEAMAIAPNPGFVVAIINCAAVILLIVGVLTGQSGWADITARQIAGLLFAVAGVALITIK